MIEVMEVLWKLTTEDTDNLPGNPEKGKQYFVEIRYKEYAPHPATGDQIWLGYDLPRYFSDGFSFPGHIDPEPLYCVKILQINRAGEKLIAEVIVLAITTLVDLLATIPVQEAPDTSMERDIDSMYRRIHIAKYRDHHFIGSDAFGNTEMYVTTTYPDGEYVTMVGGCICNARPEFKLVKFKLPEAVKKIIDELAAGDTQRYKRFSAKHDNYTPYTVREGNKIIIMTPDPED